MEKTQLRKEHCRIHPSREASHRCACCGSWICERCVQPTPLGEVCSLRCRILLFFRRIPESIFSLLRKDVPPLLGFCILLSLSVMLLLGMFRLHGELVEVAEGNARAARLQPPGAVHRLSFSRNADGITLRIDGPPDTRILVENSNGKLYLLKTNAEGSAMIRNLDPGLDAAVEFHARSLSPGWDLEEILEAPSPSPSPTPKRESTRPAGKIRVAAPVLPTPMPTLPPPTPHPSPTFRASMRAAATPTPFFTPHSLSLRPTPRPSPTPKPLRYPRPRNAPPVLHLVTDGGPRIALTFDGGASANRTAELLDLLQTLDIRATLFLTGEFIEKQPALVRRAVLAGHEIGNHSFSHPHLTTYAESHTQKLIPGMTRERFIEELQKTEQAFRRATGRSMAPLWRAPFGEENAILREWAMEAGYLHVRWSYLKGKSLDTLDWVDNEHSSLYRNSQEIVRRLLSFPHLEGGIVLMHLSTDRPEAPWAHLPEFVEALHQRKISPVKVSTLLEHSHTWKKWLEKASKRHRELYE